MKLNDYFRKFLGKISLNPTREEKIINALSNWEQKFFNDEEIEDKFMSFFSQGSYSTNTTIKPKENDEYDIDAVLLLDLDESENSKDILYWVRDRIVCHKAFEDRTKVKDRCVRINYAGDFHVDIVPALPYIDNIKIPTKKDEEWTRTNPAGFTNWCNDINKDTDGHFSKIVRIMKHWRDLKVGNDTAPKSILLTTLLGHSIEKQSSIAGTLVNTLENLIELIEDLLVQFEVHVENPSLAGENLAREWDNEKAERFLKKLKKLLVDTQDALEEEDKDKSINKWKEIFGKEYFPSNLGEGKAMADQVKANSVKVDETGQLNMGAGTKIKTHRFYGGS